jgi:predicted ATPase
VAAVAEVGERAEQTLTETMAEVLRTRTALLILDNCEHLVDACATRAITDYDRQLADAQERLDVSG